ncbi:glycosyltransferase [Idiomarina abyssalis]|uniref:glycosyltransferase n=1 Tax=Idiomarina abyssalis TaxID=86102 RepID=UPI003A92D144
MNIFIGSFGDPEAKSFGGSAAGAKVQCEIIDALRSSDKDLCALVMPEAPSWPRGDLIECPKDSSGIRFLPILNISFLKRLSFFVQVFVLVVKYRPASIFFYNSSIISCFFSLVFKFFGPRRILILQDVFSPKFNGFLSFLNPRLILSCVYIKILPFSFDLYLPITSSCVVDLRLPAQRCEVFPGATTSKRLHQCKYFGGELSNYAVYAGALEEYNGLDLLLESWPLPNESVFELHIFGVGSLENLAVRMSSINANVVYHGFKPPSVVDEYLMRSKINFCFRYSKGLDQRYFFPSKFFDLILLPGFLICNKFDAIPDDLFGYVLFVDEDMSNIRNLLLSCSDRNRNLGTLFEHVLANYTWQGFLASYCKRNFL